MTYNRHTITEKLKKGIHHVKFTKVDGTERIMPCSLDPDILPVVNITEDKKVPRKINPDTMRVYVTDVGEWRSFRIENVIEITSTGD